MAEQTFAQQQVTEPELSESDKIRKRIQDYKAISESTNITNHSDITRLTIEVWSTETC